MNVSYICIKENGFSQVCVLASRHQSGGRGASVLPATPRHRSTLHSLTYIRFGTAHNRRFNLIVPTLRYSPNDCAAIGRFKGVFRTE